MIKKIFYTASLTALAIVAILGTHMTYAAPATPDVTITPFLQEVKIQATDETKTINVSITNKAKRPQTFHITIYLF